MEREEGRRIVKNQQGEKMRELSPLTILQGAECYTAVCMCTCREKAANTEEESDTWQSHGDKTGPEPFTLPVLPLQKLAHRDRRRQRHMHARVRARTDTPHITLDTHHLSGMQSLLHHYLCHLCDILIWDLFWMEKDTVLFLFNLQAYFEVTYQFLTNVHIPFCHQVMCFLTFTWDITKFFFFYLLTLANGLKTTHLDISCLKMNNHFFGYLCINNPTYCLNSNFYSFLRYWSSFMKNPT